jgi:hypothetical protein
MSDEESKIRCWLIESIVGTTSILNIFQGQYRAKNWVLNEELLPKFMPFSHQFPNQKFNECMEIIENLSDQDQL